MAQKIIIQSMNKSDSPVDIEDKIEKAMTSIQMQRENKQFTDVYLKKRKDESDVIVKKVLSNMLDEIAEVLQN